MKQKTEKREGKGEQMEGSDRKTEAEKMYTGGSMTLRQLSEETGISFSTLSKWSKAGGWTKKRAKIRQKAIRKAANQAASKGGQEMQSLMNACGSMAKALSKAAAMMEKAMDSDDKASMSQMLDGFRAKNAQHLAAAIGQIVDSWGKIVDMGKEQSGESNKIVVEMGKELEEWAG